MKIPGYCRQSIQPRISAGRQARRTLFVRRSRGAGLIELLVASLLLSIGLMGLVNTWLFSFRVTQNTDDKGIAYNLARQTIEHVKMTGFSSTGEGAATSYFDGNQVATTSSSSAVRYKVTTSVVSDIIQSGTAGVSGAVPGQEALRTVTVMVQTVSPAQTLFTTKTYLVRAGI